MSHFNDRRAPFWGGIALIGAAALFLAAFGYLAATFDYPEVLDRGASDVLPRLVALGTPGRAVWGAYALIPLLLIPAAVGAEAALGERAPGAMKAASWFASLSAIAMVLGLARWPSLQWEMGLAWSAASPPAREALGAVFAGLNAYLGNFVGEFVGELGLNAFFLLSAVGLRRAPDQPRWAAVAGTVVGGIGVIAMFRNVTPAVEMVAAANNAILPVWLVTLGWRLARARPPASSPSSAGTRA